MMLKRLLAVAGLATVLTIGQNCVVAQPGPGGPGGGPGGGRFGDPAQMRQMMTDRLREQLDIKDDAEWKAIEPKVAAVFEARMAVGFGGGRGMGMRPPRNNGGDNAQTQRPRGGFGGQPSPAAEALQKAIDAKAPAAELKAKLEAYRAEVKEKEAALTKAQDDLKKLLTPQQEAVAVLDGLLK